MTVEHQIQVGNAQVTPLRTAEARPQLPAFGGRDGEPRYVLKALIAVNVLLAMIGFIMIAATDGLSVNAVLSDGISVLHEGAEMDGNAVDNGDTWRLLTSSFIHYGLIHLAANMIMLGLAGWKLERIIGWSRFLTLFLVSALAAGLATYAFDHDSLTAGASGANFGVFAALFLVSRRLRLPILLASILLAFGVVTTFAIPGMAIAAHLAGLVAGGGLAAWYAYSGRTERAAAA